jgi:hypothetical protein
MPTITSLGCTLSAALLALGLAACSKSQPPKPPSIIQLEEDPIALSGVLDRCNKDPALASTRECLNARAAVERRDADSAEKRAADAQAGFERAREQRRAREEKETRARQGQTAPADAYTLPVEPAK